MNVPWRCCVLLCAVALCTPAPAECQSVELGGTLGVGARGSESELVRQEARPIVGVYGSVNWSDRFEVMLRGAWLELGSRTAAEGHGGCTGCPPGVAYEVIRSSTGPRRFVSGSWLYHFRSGRTLRPFAGVGISVSRDSEQVSCKPVTVDCGSLPGLRFGTVTQSRGGPVGSVGLAMLLKKTYVLRAAVHFHRPAGEETSLFETAVMVGYRF